VAFGAVGTVFGFLCLRERGETLSQVVVREGENFDSLLRRFNKRVQMDGILSEARRRSHFEKPSVQRKRKAAAKRRKSARSTSTIGTNNTNTNTRR